MASCSNISVAFMQDETCVSSRSHTAESSEPHPFCQPLKVGSSRGLINLSQNDVGSESIRRADRHESRGMASVSSNKTFNPASKATFAERCRELMASYNTTVSDYDDYDDDDEEIDHNGEPSDISPLLPRSPAELHGHHDHLESSNALHGDNGQLKPPSELLGYDGKRRRPAKLLAYDGKKSRAAEFLEGDEQLKSPTELLGYDGKKRDSADLLTHNGKKDRPTELLGGDIRDSRKSRPPPGTWAKVRKRKAVNSEKANPGPLDTSRNPGEEKANENDIFGSFTTKQSLPRPTSGVPKQPNFTRGSLEIEVKSSLMIHH